MEEHFPYISWCFYQWLQSLFNLPSQIHLSLQVGHYPETMPNAILTLAICLRNIFLHKYISLFQTFLISQIVVLFNQFSSMMKKNIKGYKEEYPFLHIRWWSRLPTLIELLWGAGESSSQCQAHLGLWPTLDRLWSHSSGQQSADAWPAKLPTYKPLEMSYWACICHKLHSFYLRHFNAISQNHHAHKTPPTFSDFPGLGGDLRLRFS